MPYKLEIYHPQIVVNVFLTSKCLFNTFPGEAIHRQQNFLPKN